MKKDYYALLGINRDASLEDVKKSFRRMALQHHPEKNPDRRAEAEKTFAQIAEAYEVLSDSRMRAIFDQYGEDGLKHGGSGSFGVSGGYKFSGDPERIFQQFFGVANPFEQIGDFSAMQGTEHQFFSAEGARVKNPPKCPLVEFTLEVTLEEMYDGAIKLISVPVEDKDDSGKVISTAKTELRLELAKGTPKGTRILYEKKGSSRSGWIQGDILVIIAEKAHPRFRRNGPDLLMTHNITLEEALTGFSINIVTLDNRKLTVFVDEIAHPNFVKSITEEGFQLPDGTRGDLKVSFCTTFPKSLTAEQRAELKRILHASS